MKTYMKDKTLTLLRYDLRTEKADRLKTKAHLRALLAHISRANLEEIDATLNRLACEADRIRIFRARHNKYFVNNYGSSAESSSCSKEYKPSEHPNGNVIFIIRDEDGPERKVYRRGAFVVDRHYARELADKLYDIADDLDKKPDYFRSLLRFDPIMD